MIDRISSAAPAALAPESGVDAVSLARRTGGAMLDALTGGTPIGAPLREIAGAAASALSVATGRTDPVGVAQLERAALDFGREAKAFAIGHAELGPATVRSALNAALTEAEATGFPAAGFDAVDHAVSVFERAAAIINGGPAAMPN